MMDRYIFDALPKGVRAEIFEIFGRRNFSEKSVSELHLRANARSSIYVGEIKIPILHTASHKEVFECFKCLCDGGVYAHIDTIKDGYIVARGGVRVGVCARARYDKDVLYGVDDISSLAFRIPTDLSLYDERLLAFFNECKKGMLIFAPVRYGKTSSLKILSSMLASVKEGLEVSVIDERGEFLSLDRRGLSLDVLTGYKKARGFEIALRTMCPDVIILDELSGIEECRGLLSFLRSGVRVVASTHAGEFDDLKNKSGINLLIERGVFDVVVGISVLNGERIFERYV